MDMFLLMGLCVLSVVGVVDIARKLKFWMYKPGKTPYYMGVVIEDIDEAENAVRTLMERLKWMNLGAPIKVYIVDKTKSEEVKEIVEKVIEKFPNVSLL